MTTSIRLISPRLLLFVVLFTPVLNAQSSEDPGAVEANLKSIYEGNVVTLRGFYSDSVLDYDETGVLTGKSVSGPWTLDGKVRVDGVNLKNGNEKLVFSCTRIVVGMGKGSKSLQDFITYDKVELNIKVDAPFQASQIYGALAAIFMKKGESMADLVPGYWKHYFGGKTPAPPPATATGKTTRVQVSSGIAAGRLINPVAPVYPAFAKSKRYSGSVILQAVIGVDGTMSSLSIVRPAGMGFDEAAADAVKQWKYKPYLLNGVPTEVDTRITVNFKMGG